MFDKMPFSFDYAGWYVMFKTRLGGGLSTLSRKSNSDLLIFRAFFDYALLGIINSFIKPIFILIASVIKESRLRTNTIKALEPYCMG